MRPRDEGACDNHLPLLYNKLNCHLTICFVSIYIRCHDFRVTFCTTCYEAEVPVKTLQVWMGHTDPTVLMKFYAKLTEEKEQYDTSKLNALTKQRFNR